VVPVRVEHADRGAGAGVACALRDGLLDQRQALRECVFPPADCVDGQDLGVLGEPLQRLGRLDPDVEDRKDRELAQLFQVGTSQCLAALELQAV